jgi:ankyrin repeat protein
MAQDLWQHVQRGWHAAVYEDESLREQDHGDYLEMEHQVEVACKRAREIAAQRKGNEVDIIEEIFFPKDEDIKEEKKDTQGAEEDQEQGRVAAKKVDREESVVPRSTAQDVEELQKAQREQLEEEIAHMACRLKESTQHINTTLKSQTEELEEMETLATQNVEKVGAVADDVTQHHRKAWRNSIATWTMILAVLGSFFFCMVTIRMVPKRKSLFVGYMDQKEVCSRMADGSVICVGADRIPYIKKNAPVSGREAQENKKQVENAGEKQQAQECEVGLSGECIVPPKAVNEHVDTDRDTPRDGVCGENGDCKAQLEEDAPSKHQENSPEEENDEVKTEDLNTETHREVEHDKREDASSAEPAESRHKYLSQPEEPHVQGEDANIDFDDMDVRQAARYGDIALLKRYVYLMPQYASVRDENGWQAIHEAVRASQTGCVEVLLDEGRVDVNARTGLINDGTTALWLVYNNGLDDNHDLVRLLKARGGISIGPGEGLPYKTKEELTHEEFEQYTFEDFHDAAKEGDAIRVAQYIVAKRELVEVGDENGWQAIHETVRHGHPISTQLLINAGADFNALGGLDGNGWSPLALSLELHGEDHPVTRLLRKHGAVAFYPKEHISLHRSMS